MKNKFFIAISISLITYGIFIIFSKQLPQGNGGMGTYYVYIGNYAYIIGSIFIFSGIYFYKNFIGKKE